MVRNVLIRTLALCLIFASGCKGDSSGSPPEAAQSNVSAALASSRLIRPPPPGPGGKIVYCSTDNSIPSGDGTSYERPLHDLSAAKARISTGKGDRLALHRGDKFGPLGQWTKSGASATDRVMICSWGEASKPDPLIESGNSDGLAMYSQNVAHVAIVGIDFRGGDPGANNAGIIANGCDADDVLIENCDLSNFNSGIVTTGPGRRSNWKIRGTVVADCYDPGNPYSGNGMFFHGMHGYEIERCLILRNGVRPDGSFTAAHGIYNMAEDGNHVQSTSGLIARDSIFALNGNTGLSARAGGLFEDDLFVGNAIAWNVGASNTPIQGGVSFTARRVVTTESRGIGWGGWTRNLNPNKPSLIEDAIIANAGPGTQNRSYLLGGNNTPDPGWTNGPVAGLTTRRMIIHGHGQGPEIGDANAKNLTFEDCEGPAITGAANVTGLVQTGKKFGDQVSGYPDPTRTVARYDREVLGGPGTVAHFTQEARKSWPKDPRFSAEAVNKWIADGYGKTWP